MVSMVWITPVTHANCERENLGMKYCTKLIAWDTAEAGGRGQRSCCWLLRGKNPKHIKQTVKWWVKWKQLYLMLTWPVDCEEPACLGQHTKGVNLLWEGWRAGDSSQPCATEQTPDLQTGASLFLGTVCGNRQLSKKFYNTTHCLLQPARQQ